jgi:hypothetical protein
LRCSFRAGGEPPFPALHHANAACIVLASRAFADLVHRAARKRRHQSFPQTGLQLQCAVRLEVTNARPIRQWAELHVNFGKMSAWHHSGATGNAWACLGQPPGTRLQVHWGVLPHTSDSTSPSGQWRKMCCAKIAVQTAK